MAENRTPTVDSLLTGARQNVKQTRGMREHLATLFRGDDYVKVKNSLDQEFGYVYTDPKGETVNTPDKVTRLVQFADPKARVMQPGKTIVMQGWEAYIAITHMWKQYAQTQGTAKMSVVLSNTSSMKAFLEKTYLGKFDPAEINLSADIDVPKDVETKADEVNREDLGFANDDESDSSTEDTDTANVLDEKESKPKAKNK